MNQTINGLDPTGVSVGMGLTQSLDGKVLIGSGTTSSLTGYYLKGIITEVGAATSTVKVKVNSYIDPNGDEVDVDYSAGGTFSLKLVQEQFGIHSVGGDICF